MPPVPTPRQGARGAARRLPLLLPFLVAACLPGRAHPRVIGAAILPHGDFAFDPSLVHGANHSVELHEGARRVGAAVAALAPDLIVLTTPHGIEAERDFAFYKNSNGSGFAHLGDDLHNASFPGYDVGLNVSMDPATVLNVTAAIRALHTDANVSTLLSFADGEPQALRWGEVIPLKLVFDEYPNATAATAPAATRTGGQPVLPTVVVWSVPSRRYTETESMVGSGELTTLGGALATALEALPQRVLLLVSADLAHTHLASGPYGFSKDAAPFDAACGRWARTLDSGELLDTALQHAVHAESCGYTGLVVLDGFVRAVAELGGNGALQRGDPGANAADAAAAGQVPRQPSFLRRQRGEAAAAGTADAGFSSARGGSAHQAVWNTSLVVGPFHPTYYGMMTAMFQRTAL